MEKIFLFSIDYLIKITIIMCLYAFNTIDTSNRAAN